MYHDGRLSVAFQSTGYYSTQEEPQVPRLTDIQLEALRVVQALAIDPELSIHFQLQPGDIQLLHNTTVLHGREGFHDGEVRRAILYYSQEMCLPLQGWTSKSTNLNLGIFQAPLGFVTLTIAIWQGNSEIQSYLGWLNC